MTRPIVLWQSERTSSTDNAGVVIISSTSPPKVYFQPGPYYDEDSPGTTRSHFQVLEPFRPIPPLSFFCIKCLVQVPELIYHYGPPRPYRPPACPSDPDILQALIPRNQQGDFDLSKLDPRLWAILIQIYSDLPQNLRIYRTALSDKYTPLLQHVPATEHFTLLTVLEFPGCSHLNDDTIVHFKTLHTLCVLDASRSALSAIGIRRLSGTQVWVEEDDTDFANRRRGPWQLRILSLHNCKRVTNAIYQYLESFMLLTAVDLRGTSCTWDREKIPSSFFPAVDKRLFYPTNPLKALSLLSDSVGVLPSSNSGILHIDHLTHENHNRGGSARELFGIGCSLMEDDSNKALLACHRACSPPDPSNPPSTPECTPSFQRLPRSRPTNESPRGSTEELESGPTELHTVYADVATESGTCTAQDKAKMFYSHGKVDLGSSVTHPRRHMPQWGQELLMLYREPPPWSQAQLSPIVKSARTLRSLENPMSVDRTNERATKGVQDMWGLLSERRRSAQREADSSCDSVKVSTSHSVSRNPFAAPFGKSLTQMACEEAPTLSRTSAMIPPPKSSRYLKPISTLPIPIPPDSSRRITANNERESMAAICEPRRSQDSGRQRRQVSLPLDERCGQKVDVSLDCRTGRSAERIEPVAGRKRPRLAVSASGSKKQDRSNSRSSGFDWSSWGKPR